MLDAGGVGSAKIKMQNCGTAGEVQSENLKFKIVKLWNFCAKLLFDFFVEVGFVVGESVLSNHFSDFFEVHISDHACGACGRT